MNSKQRRTWLRREWPKVRLAVAQARMDPTFTEAQRNVLRGLVQRPSCFHARLISAYAHACQPLS